MTRRVNLLASIMLFLTSAISAASVGLETVPAASHTPTAPGVYCQILRGEGGPLGGVEVPSGVTDRALMGFIWQAWEELGLLLATATEQLVDLLLHEAQRQHKTDVYEAFLPDMERLQATRHDPTSYIDVARLIPITLMVWQGKLRYSDHYGNDQQPGYDPFFTRLKSSREYQEFLQARDSFAYFLGAARVVEKALQRGSAAGCTP